MEPGLRIEIALYHDDVLEFVRAFGRLETVRAGAAVLKTAVGTVRKAAHGSPSKQLNKRLVKSV